MKNGGPMINGFDVKIMMKSSDINDKSTGSTKTKYIKLNTKTQIFFCYVNENLMTFLHTSTGGQENRRRKKSFLF